MSEPEKVDTSSQPTATAEKPQRYKCLLNQYAQRSSKQLPIYQTCNEGPAHLPNFRSTVWFDGASYTSPNTFHQRKMAEMDASKVAFFATMHKLKTEASSLVCKDKFFCKSILAEFAAKMNIEKPSYQTSKLDTPVPVFRSSLAFGDVSCTGNDSRSKKEAEHSAACAVILKYLESCADTESGNIMSEIIISKFRRYAKMKDGISAHNGSNAVVQSGFDNCLTLNEDKVEEGTEIPNTSALPEPCHVQGTNSNIPATNQSEDITQTNIPEVSTQALTPVIPTTHLTSNAVQPEHLEASSVAVAPPLPFVSDTSGKKRNRKNKKKPQKKRRVENQLTIPTVAVSQVPTFSAQ